MGWPASLLRLAHKINSPSLYSGMSVGAGAMVVHKWRMKSLCYPESEFSFWAAFG